MDSTRAETAWRTIDDALAAALPSAADGLKWLLVQTIASAAQRRALIGSLRVSPQQRVLDLGCGFGAATLELASLGDIQVVGLDTDPSALGSARLIGRAVTDRGGVPVGRAVFSSGDAYAMPFPNGCFDIVFSRFVFQHLDDPEQAAGEVARVLAPGGTACIVDVDDGLSISEPAPSPAFERLASGLRSLQSAKGGDRHIGRRLAGLLDRQGLAPGPIIVMPQAAYHRPDPSGPERLIMLERLRSRRAEIVGGGYLGAEDFDGALDEFAREDRGPTCEIEAHLAVFATKPGLLATKPDGPAHAD